MDPLVLVVDDEPHLLRLLSRVLERAGYGIVPAADGDAAIDAIRAHGPEPLVLVLDVSIPPRGADVVLDVFEAHALAAGLVMVSGDALEEALAARVEAFGGCFLRKPFLPEALIDAVRSQVRPAAGVARA
jgi:two-component system KDP operon response regulator KdpE/two-component system response regulator VicR